MSARDERTLQARDRKHDQTNTRTVTTLRIVWLACAVTIMPISWGIMADHKDVVPRPLPLLEVRGGHRPCRRRRRA